MTDESVTGIAPQFHPPIDKEFKALVPPLTADESAQLEANICAEGCRDPLVVWQEKGVLLDGHNRLEICKRLGIEYRVERMRFESREQAYNWIIGNQLGRRNLHPDQASYLRGKRYNLEKAAQGGTGANQHAPQKDQNDPSAKTADRLATEYKVSPATIKRDGRYTQAVDTLAAAGIEPHQVVAHEPKSAIIEFAVAITPEPEAPETPLIPRETKPADPIVAEVTEKVKRGEMTVVEASKAIAHNHRAQGTGENEWYTPSEHIEAARAVLGAIDLDPASSPLANEAVGAERFFTQADDGLAQPWSGRIWLNPPYSQPAISQFAEKLASEWESGNLNSAIALTHNYTDTGWFHRLASSCKAICFTRGRIGFVNPEGKKAAPTQGQAFFYFGEDAAGFVDRFRSIGFVVEVRS